MKTPEQFWACVEPEGDCLVWTRHRRDEGHGSLTYQGKPTLAHRVAYLLAKGPIPDGLLVRHTCDNAPCCSPEHLILGTHQDNMRDAAERGRMKGGKRWKTW